MSTHCTTGQASAALDRAQRSGDISLDVRVAIRDPLQQSLNRNPAAEAREAPDPQKAQRNMVTATTPIAAKPAQLADDGLDEARATG